MCTCVKLVTKDNMYFLRSMDNCYHFSEGVLVTPKNFVLSFKHIPKIVTHYSLIGMGKIQNNYPLYAEAVNEKGLSMAALSFDNHSYYFSIKDDKINIAPYEFILYILGKCKNIAEAKKIIHEVNICSTDFDDATPNTALHWMIADLNNCIVIESTTKGLSVYDNPINVLTNSPPFSYHFENINNYLNIKNYVPKNTFIKNLPLKPNSLGIGGISLPGDYSSPSRFIKGAYLANNCFEIEDICKVTQAFHIIDSVSPVKGAVITQDNKYHYMTYSCCIDTQNLIYYYKTYENTQIYSVHLLNEDLSDNKLKFYKPSYIQKFLRIN